MSNFLFFFFFLNKSNGLVTNTWFLEQWLSRLMFFYSYSFLCDPGFPAARPCCCPFWLSACWPPLALVWAPIQPSPPVRVKERHLRSSASITRRWDTTSISLPDRGLCTILCWQKCFFWFFFKKKWNELGMMRCAWCVCCTGTAKETLQTLWLQMCWWGRAQRPTLDPTTSGIYWKLHIYWLTFVSFEHANS